MNRHQARKNAFVLVFESLFSDTSVEEMFQQHIENGWMAQDEYTLKVACGVVQKRDQLDDQIRPFLRNWTIQSISGCSRAILEIAIYEMLYENSVDHPVAINEAVEFAKEYCGDDDPAFVNGVLGSFVRSIAP